MLSLSKSMEKAMGCVRYFALSYISGDPALAGSSPLAQTGTDFHRYRAEYVDHLLRTKTTHDNDWAFDRLSKMEVTEDARELIARDIPRFMIDPELVFGTELFLSVDDEFNPLDMRDAIMPGEIPTDPRSLAHGTIDLLSIDGDEAEIRDYKTGYSNVTVSDYEPAHYAALVFAHFPAIRRVKFCWEFIRAGARKPFEFTREDLEWIQPTIRSMRERMLRIVELVEAGGELPVDPTAGMCGYCGIRCPVRESFEKGVSDLQPIQSDDDARALAARYNVANKWTLKAAELLKSYLDQRGSVDLPDGLVAELKVSQGTEYPLRPTLKALGIDVPEKSPKWDVPLSGLKIGATALKSYGHAIKRRGMIDALEPAAHKVPRSELRIYRPNPDNLPKLLQESIELAGGAR